MTTQIRESRPHPTGGNRAYKKVGGRELQFYSQNKAEADAMQEKFDSIAALHRKEPFSRCGRLVGFRFQLRVRKGRQPYICLKGQLGPSGNRKKCEYKYQGSFEQSWRELKQIWAQWHGLRPADVADYTDMLKQAKRLYMKDIGAFEYRIEQLMSPQTEPNGPGL